jgi:hypothetical protein
MSYVKSAGLCALTAMAMMGLGTGSASATTLEIGGVAQGGAVAITVSLKSGTSLIMKDTQGFSVKTCTAWDFQAQTSSPFTGASVTAPISSMSITGCTRPAVVHDPGKLEITWTSGTNGKVAWEDAHITTGSAIGTLTCTTGPTTNIGTLTGVASGHATIDVNAVLNCGIIPSTKLEAGLTVTSPTGLGVVS